MRQFAKIGFILYISALLTGCAQSPLIFNKESLTGLPCCKIRSNQLQSTHDKTSAELILKTCSDTKAATGKKGTIQAVLTVIYRGEKNYDFAPTDQVTLKIEGTHYPIDVVHTLNSPITEVAHHYISLPTGRISSFGIPKDLTVKTLVLLLSYDMLSKLANTQRAELELTTSK